MLLYTHVPRVALASSNQILSLFAHRQWIDLMKFGKKAAAQIASRHCANVRKITDDCRDNNLGYHPSSFSLGEGSSLVIYFALHLRVLSGIMIMISIRSDIILKLLLHGAHQIGVFRAPHGSGQKVWRAHGSGQKIRTS